nr:dead helicase [Mimivirus sp.]
MSYKNNINELIDNKPCKPTIIFIKDKLRLGEYLNTKYVYVVHDDPNNMYTHTTAQSLLGRCCGYGKANHKTIIYCDHNKAYEHYIWIINDYDVEHIPRHAKYITKNNTIKQICIY